MEFGFTEEQQKLRKEIHDFFVNELPEDYQAGPLRVMGNQDEEEKAFWMELQSKAVERGWLTAGWPKKYGGLGFSAIEQGVVSEEMAYWSVRWPGFRGLGLMGPTILSIGTDEQKARFIPPIARGEADILQAFTEPEAGSDEANVQLRAVPDGDDFILNGQKTFITGDSRPDWLYTLTKTADTTPKHRGLSIFMVDANSPGITFKPLPTMGSSKQSEVFYDNVRVSKNNLIGELNRGFYAAMTSFEFERASVGADVRRSMEWWVDICRKETRNGNPLIEDPEARKLLAQIAIDTEISWLHGWYGVWSQTQREKLGPLPYDLTALQMKGSSPPTAKGLMDMCGLYGQLMPESKWTKFEGMVQRRWEGSHILHPQGTPEILKYVISNRGLGLPRVPKQFNVMINEALSRGEK